MAKLVSIDQYHIEICSNFCAEVETLVSTNRLSYVDAVLIIADRRKIEPDLAAKYINPDIMSNMQAEWETKNMLAKTAKLPF